MSLCTVRRWVEHAGDERLDRVDFAGRRAAPSTEPRGSVGDRVLSIRKRLKEQSDLGEYGAEAIRREMARLKLKGAPSVRTIGRALPRRGALDGRRRVRRRVRRPPPGLD